MGTSIIFTTSLPLPSRPRDQPLTLNAAPVDLAIVGIASPDAIEASPTIAQLKPRLILPSHQDDFFRPLRNGFVFLPLTDFPAVRAGFGQFQ